MGNLAGKEKDIEFTITLLAKIRTYFQDPLALIDLEVLTPEELCQVYLMFIERYYGPDYASASHIWYKRGWNYVAIAIQIGGRVVLTIFSTPKRKLQVITHIEELRSGE